MGLFAILLAIPLSFALDFLVGVLFLDGMSSSKIALIMIPLTGIMMFMLLKLIHRLLLAPVLSDWERLARQSHEDANASTTDTNSPVSNETASRLHGTHEFRMGALGHLLYIFMICAAGCWFLIPHSKHGKDFWILTACALYFGITAIIALALGSRFSLWYRGPVLITDPKGIHTRGCFIPWSDVLEVHHGGGRSTQWNIYITTAQGRSTYRIIDGKEVPYEPKIIVVKAMGASPESMAHYLDVRAKLERQALVSGTTA